MNKKVVIVMIGAFIMAMLVAMMVQSSLAPKKEVKAAPKGVEILVVAKNMNMGDILKTTDTKWKRFPEDTLFSGVIKKSTEEKDMPDVYNKSVSRNLVTGEPITMQSVISPDDAKGLATKLRPGMRAIGIKVKPETSAGGFVAPGDFVDLVLTYQVKLTGDVAKYSGKSVQKVASETILRNLRVLAVDQEDKGSSYEAKVNKTVTLEVTPKQAQEVKVAAAMGELSLSLRRIGEEDDGVELPVTTDIEGSKIMNDIYSRMNKSRAKDDIIKVYNGSQVEEVKIEGAPKR